jgi:aryl-alcohol dehydrogenase-like predicted oxidoreductase
MKTRQLGRTGLTVPPIGLGCMGMSFAYGPSDESQCLRTLHESLDLGVNFWDTAEIYGPYKNEELLGQALQSRRDKVIIATKFAWQIGPNGERIKLDGSRANLRRALEGSLKRLRTDYVDLFYQHRLDPATPVEETVAAMAELIKEGKVRHIGLSEVGPITIRKAHAICPLAAVQSEYSLWETGVQARVLPVLRELGIGLVAYSPIGRGFLTGTIQKEADLPADDFRRTVPRFQGKNFKDNLRLVEAVRALALAKQATPAQIALAWLLRQGPDIIPIPGTTKTAHLAENVGAVSLELTEQDWADVSAILKRFPVSGARYPEAMMKFVEVP